MKIAEHPFTVDFIDLACGEVFQDARSNYCMKIEYNHDANVVYLSDGSLGYADDCLKVKRIECELTVRNP